MKPFWIILTATLVFGFVASIAFANPEMLPKHPGYPMGKATSPVTGQPLANDAGQANAGGEKALREAAGFDDARSVQKLADPNNQRVIKSEGAGQLPKVQGPQIKIEPPVKEGTRINASPDK